MTTHKPSTNDPTRAAAVAMMRAGIANPSEVARLAGVSRQLAHYWARGIDLDRARSKRLEKEWRKRTSL